MRNQQKVIESSLIQKKITIEEHLEYFSKLKQKGFYNYFKLKHNNNIVAIGYGKDFNKNEKSCSWGFYRDLNIKSDIKYGSIIKYYLLEELFGLGLEKITCQVLYDNKWIIDWHIRWGHVITSFNENKMFYNLELKKEKWQSIKKKILSQINIQKL